MLVRCLNRTQNNIIMVAWSYGISLRVFNSISISRTRYRVFNSNREIPYLRAPMYYTPCAYLKLKAVKKQILKALTVLPKLPGLERRAGSVICDQSGRLY